MCIWWEIMKFNCLLVSSNKIMKYLLADYLIVMFIWRVFHLQMLVTDYWHWDGCSNIDSKQNSNVREQDFQHWDPQIFQGAGTDEGCLVEILCTRTNEEIEAIKEAYKLKYETTLEEDIVGDTSGDFRRFMVSLLQANRDENYDIDQDKVYICSVCWRVSCSVASVCIVMGLLSLRMHC